MRVFVAVQPPEPVLDEIEDAVAQLGDRVGAEQVGNLRWATRDQWHVTLRFLGEVADEVLPELTAALDAAPLAAAEAELGPAFVRLGQQVLCLPVSGVDDLAAAVVAATRTMGQPPESRPYRGHVTVARVRGRSEGGIHRSVVNTPIRSLRWAVDEVRIVRSHLGGAGARYEDLHVRHLDAEVGTDGT